MLERDRQPRKGLIYSPRTRREAERGRLRQHTARLNAVAACLLFLLFSPAQPASWAGTGTRPHCEFGANQCSNPCVTVHRPPYVLTCFSRNELATDDRAQHSRWPAPLVQGSVHRQPSPAPSNVRWAYLSAPTDKVLFWAHHLAGVRPTASASPYHPRLWTQRRDLPSVDMYRSSLSLQSGHNFQSGVRMLACHRVLRRDARAQRRTPLSEPSCGHFFPAVGLDARGCTICNLRTTKQCFTYRTGTCIPRPLTHALLTDVSSSQSSSCVPRCASSRNSLMAASASSIPRCTLVLTPF